MPKPNLRCLHDAATTLGIKPHLLMYLIVMRRVPEPLTFRSCRLFSQKDIRHIRELITADPTILRIGKPHG